MQDPQVHVGRQAIYDVDLNVVGYELLFRHAAEAGSAVHDGDAATTAVILGTFAEFGVESLVGSHPVYINLTRAFLVGDLPVPFGPRGTVLEILETVEVDEALVGGVARLKEQGYRLALDDFVWRPEADPLLDLVDVVKVDMLTASPEEVELTIVHCAGRDVTLLAERVEDAEVLQLCRDQGFTLFQGYHLARPQTVTTSSLTPSHVTALRLLTELGRPDSDIAAVEELVRIDPALTYRLLRIVNSADVGLNRRLTSLREALVLVGMRQLHGWLLLLTLSDIVPGDDRLENAVARAKACELLAKEVPGTAPESAFMVGLVEGLREMLGLSVSEVSVQLGLDPVLAEALDGPYSPLGVVLFAVLSHERQDHTGVRAAGVDMLSLSHHYLQAIQWSRAACEATTS